MPLEQSEKLFLKRHGAVVFRLILDIMSNQIQLGNADARHAAIQSSLRDWGNLRLGHPALKRRAIIARSLRDKENVS